jgi:hypothetical protein
MNWRVSYLCPLSLQGTPVLELAHVVFPRGRLLFPAPDAGWARQLSCWLGVLMAWHKQYKTLDGWFVPPGFLLQYALIS